MINNISSQCIIKLSKTKKKQLFYKNNLTIKLLLRWKYQTHSKNVLENNIKPQNKKSRQQKGKHNPTFQAFQTSSLCL